MGAFRGVDIEGGDRPDHLGNVILCGGLSGVTIWGRDLGADSSNVTDA